jgi:hypothetical protein
VLRGGQQQEGRVNEEVSKVHVYEYGTMKPVEVVSGREWEKREINGGGNQTGI